MMPLRGELLVLAGTWQVWRAGTKYLFAGLFSGPSACYGREGWRMWRMAMREDGCRDMVDLRSGVVRRTSGWLVEHSVCDSAEPGRACEGYSVDSCCKGVGGPCGTVVG